MCFSLLIILILIMTETWRLLKRRLKTSGLKKFSVSNKKISRNKQVSFHFQCI